MTMTLKDDQWIWLLRYIDEKKCTPFIGAGAASQILPSGKEIAQKWAKEFDYPLEDSNQLSRVAQFLAIQNRDEMYPKNMLSVELRDVEPPNFRKGEHRNSPYSVLADLALPIYITTNYDYFMEKALMAKDREPVTDFCRWNNYAQAAGIPSVFDESNKFKPSPSKPLVYHLHGVIDIPQTMVLTESDYIDFIVNSNSLSNMIPPMIRTALSTSSLLFVGYSLQDVNFRILFRSVANFLGSNFLYSNVAVLLPFANVQQVEQQKVQKYLDEYAKNMFKVTVYWGDGVSFSTELRDRLNKFHDEKD